MYLFYNFCTNLRVSNDHFVHHQEFMIYCVCSSVQTVQSMVCTELQLYNRSVFWCIRKYENIADPV